MLDRKSFGIAGVNPAYEGRDEVVEKFGTEAANDKVRNAFFHVIGHAGNEWFAQNPQFRAGRKNFSNSPATERCGGSRPDQTTARTKSIARRGATTTAR